MLRFALNDAVLIVSAKRYVIGCEDRPDVDIPIRGETRRAAVSLLGSQHETCIKPIVDSPAVWHNGRRLRYGVSVKHEDEILLGDALIRVHEPCPTSLSPIFELAPNSGVFALSRGFSRLVYMRRSVHIASHHPCHVGLEGLDLDSLELVRERDELWCQSTTGRSIISADAESAASWTAPVRIPGQLIVRPLDRDLSSTRRPVRLRFDPV